MIGPMLTMLALVLFASSASGSTFGQHGMVLFGGADGLYAAHLPMFHAPHDYQVVLEIRLADPALDTAMRQRLAAEPGLWTLAPETFALDRLAPGATRPLQGFKGDLVLGHFEQGGKTQHPNAAIIVERVLLFRRLLPHGAVASTARYLQLGTGARRFLVKQVDSRPDFDHIVAIDAASATPTAVVVAPKTGLTKTLDTVIEALLPGARVRATLYYATEDLQ